MTLEVDAAALTEGARAGLALGVLDREKAVWTLKDMDGVGFRSLWDAPRCPQTPADWEAVLAAYAAARQKYVADKARDEESARRGDQARKEADARKEAEKQERMAAAAARFLADPSARALSVYTYGVGVERNLSFPPGTEVYEEAVRRDRADKDALAAARRDWVETHGSDFLKKAVAAGYDCQRRYVTERAALELPGFAVDFDDNASWKSRSCPSEAALELALSLAAFGAEVVWLTDAPNADAEPYFEPCEAVAVCGYLGKYGAVRPL